MEKPKISIIIPTYNRAKKIVGAIRSIQDQTYEDWELIIVDDGSSDNTCEIVEKVANSDRRIKFIRLEKNKGAQAARNRGIRAAKSEWIAFLDSDDQWLPQSLDLRLKVAERENVQIVHSQALVIYPGDKTELYTLSPFSGWVHKEILSKDGPMFQCLLVKKAALEKIGYLDESLPSFQEWDTSIRLAKIFAFGFENSPTFIYDFRTTDAISRNPIRTARGCEMVVRKHLKDMILYAGLETLWNHYDTIAHWYKMGNDQFDFFRCKLVCSMDRCVTPQFMKRFFLTTLAYTYRKAFRNKK